MKIYIYNILFNKMIGVKKAAKALNAQIITISKDDLHSSIEYILGRSKANRAGKDASTNVTELLLFEDFSSENLDDFLDIYKSTGLEQILYKAVITPINMKWSPAYLYEHLKNEIGALKN